MVNEEQEIEYENQNIIQIEHEDFLIDYLIESNVIMLSWYDEENDEDMEVCIYSNNEWHLEESPINDIELLNNYLNMFKEYICKL